MRMAQARELLRLHAHRAARWSVASTAARDTGAHHFRASRIMAHCIPTGDFNFEPDSDVSTLCCKRQAWRQPAGRCVTLAQLSLRADVPFALIAAD